LTTKRKKQLKKSRALLGQISDTDIRLLRVFRTVVNCGGMAAAELELNIGTSTVSRHIKDLETRLGLTLCTRGRAGFSLTPEGSRVYEETQRLIASIDLFRRGIDDIHGRLGGKLNVAIFDKTATNPEAHIGEAFALFHQQAPEVSLNVYVSTINAIERGVIDGEFQIGIIPAHRTSSVLDYSELFKENMLLYCGRSHPLYDAADGRLTWESLRNYSFAGLGEHSPNMELSHKRQLPSKATCFDQEAIVTLILSGNFLGFLPDHYGHIFERSGKIRSIAPARFNYECRFVSLQRRSPQPARVVQLLNACLAEAHAPTPKSKPLTRKPRLGRS
jgi:DNA-binding transcriptional LysR family regulator